MTCVLTLTCLERICLSLRTVPDSIAVAARSSVCITSSARASAVGVTSPATGWFARNIVSAVFSRAAVLTPFPPVRKLYFCFHSVSFCNSSPRFRKSQKFEMIPDFVKYLLLIETIPMPFGSKRLFRFIPSVTLLMSDASVFSSAISFCSSEKPLSSYRSFTYSFSANSPAE